MNRTPVERQRRILQLFVEGTSINSIHRLVGSSQTTILSLLRKVGMAVHHFHDRVVRDLPCTRLELDEIWTYCRVKRDNLRYAKTRRPGDGDLWLWVAICPDTKLVVSWRVGDRTSETARPFLRDLRARLKHRVQISTDGHDAYLEAVEEVFGNDVDYAREVKVMDKLTGKRRTVTEVVRGKPNPDLIGTTFVERFNASLRTFCHRYIRRTYGVSKDSGYHQYAVALAIMDYNFCRVHGTLRGTPAMQAGLTSRIWGMDELLALIR
jgi:IS1 family transposase